MRRLSSLVLAVCVVLLVVASLHEGPANESLAQTACFPSATPSGQAQQSPSQPIWCVPHPLPDGAPTYDDVAEAHNMWLDDFNHGLTNNAIRDGYFVFDAVNSVFRSEHFRSNNHWMVDVAGYDQNGPTGPYWNFGGGTM